MLPVLLLACGPGVDVAQDSGGATTSGSGGSEEGSTSGTTAPMTTVAPTTVPPDPATTDVVETTGSFSTTGTETGADSSTGADACGPIDDVVALVRLDNGGAPGASTLACTIDGVESGAEDHEIALSCEGVTHTLRLTTPSAPAVPLAAEVVLDVHRTAAVYSQDLVLRLTTPDGALILAGSASDAIAGEDDVAADFFAPLSVAVMSGICEPVQPPGGDFIGTCAYAREAITFGLAGDEVTILDHNRDALASGFEAVVEIAERREDAMCPESERWYQWVVYEPIAK